MASTVYLQGMLLDDGISILCPLPSCAVIFFLRYCDIHFHVKFVSSKVLKGDLPSACKISKSALIGMDVSFIQWEEAPAVVRNTCLPSIYQLDASLIRAGLCVVLRNIIKSAHAEFPSRNLIDLLGFRQGSMRMCSEVSGWTKLCEVELPTSLSTLIEQVKNLKSQQKSKSELAASFTLPPELIKLESHFRKKCLVHNDDKKRRAELVRVKGMLSSLSGTGENSETINCVQDISSKIESVHLCEKAGSMNKTSGELLSKLSWSGDHIDAEHTVFLPHGVRKVRTSKIFKKDLGKEVEVSNSCRTEEEGHKSSVVPNSTIDLTDVNRDSNVDSLDEIIKQLSYLNVDFIHTYSEGPEMTLADLTLFVYIYFLLEQLNFDCTELKSHLPSIFHWADHMSTLATVYATASSLGWDVNLMFRRFTESQGCCTLMGNENNHDLGLERFHFNLPHDFQQLGDEEDDAELSRNVRIKHKAIKPEVYQALGKLEDADIKPLLGQHPRKDQVTIDWDNLPAGVHPKQGDVPEKRTKRKCQQLENLVTAVIAVAKPGDAIVDFCSGGGHLGIVLAHLLPECQVYLVENKEESLLKVCSRLKSVNLNNVTLYQCNIDYFIGNFDIGVCLHACGSATDMVLQLCLEVNASFVICPCCYGSIQRTHLLSYPRSKQFQASSITYKDFLTLGHAADQTEFNIKLEGQGRHCMNLVDSDRAAYARESGYQVSLCSLQPLSCTPKNNLLVGTPS